MISPMQLENRAGLTPRQAEAVAFVAAYRDLTGEDPPARLVGRKLDVSRTAAFNLITRARAKTRPGDPAR
jgi:hypothetical protein